MTVAVELEIDEDELKALGTKFGKVLFRMLKAVSDDFDCTIDFVVANMNLSQLSFTYK